MSSKLDYISKEHFDTVIKEKFDKVMEKLDLVINEYRNHEEEHVLINGKLSEHSDDIEVIKEKLHIQL